MNNVQKVIKYIAITLAVVLIVGIITGILTIVGTIFGISTLIDMTNNNIAVHNFTKEYENIHSIEIDISSIDLELITTAETNVNNLKIEGLDIPTEYKFEENNGVLKVKGKSVKSNSKLVMYVPNMLNDLDIDIGAGNIQIDNINTQEFSLGTGATNANINNLEVSRNADIDAGTGNITIKDANISNLDVDAGIGKLEYTGYLNGFNDINCGIGKVELNLQGKESSYRITAEKGIGEVKINGNKVSGTQTLGNGSNIIKVSGGIGSLDIRY